MNYFLILTIASVLLCLATSGVLFRKRNISEIAVLGIAFFFCSYIFSTIALFALDAYTLFRGIAATCLLNILLFSVAFLSAKPFSAKKWKSFFQPDMHFQAFIIPVIVSLIGLCVSANPTLT